MTRRNVPSSSSSSFEARARGAGAATREVDRLAKIIGRRVGLLLLLPLARELTGAKGENGAPTAARVMARRRRTERVGLCRIIIIHEFMHES